MRLGTFGSVSAPVEDTIVRSSMVDARAALPTSEPVAMTMLLASSRCLSPLASVTPTLPGPRMVPLPWNVSILFFLSR